MKSNSNTGAVFWMIIAILMVVIVGTFVIGIIGVNIQQMKENNHEKKLIEEGKTKLASDVVNEVVEILKDRDEEKLKSYLADDFVYYDNNRYESKSTSNLWRDVKYLTSSYDIEKRGNSIENEETYMIYWNIVEGNVGLGRTSQYYCLQKINIYLRRIVKQDEITYQIYKIIITKN